MTRPTIASITAERDALNEKLRQSNERHLEASLAFTRAASKVAKVSYQPGALASSSSPNTSWRLCDPIR